jgi:hypothetical protein
MTIKFTALLPAAALLLFTSVTRAQSGHISSEVPGVVQLTHALDSRKLSVGTIIQTRLIDTIHLANGVRLPSGTLINAAVVQDDMQIEGKVKLALRFTEARMKNGKTIPITATILDLATRPEAVENDSDIAEPTLDIPDNLNNRPDRVDVINVISGVDLHGRANSQNSGVFVTTTKNDIKLPNNTQIELALAPGT